MITLENVMAWTDGDMDDSSVLYDVCADYSLDRDDATDAEFEARKYVWCKLEARGRDGLMEGVVGIHKHHEEVHYWFGPDGMKGAFLFTDDMQPFDVIDACLHP